MHDIDIDGFDRRYIFCMWVGDNPMSPDLATELFSVVSNTHCPVVYLNSSSIKKWELPNSPFHKALPYLSQVHASDYLRMYLLHHYGGGYTDIKFTYKQWDTAFELLRDSDAELLGRTVEQFSGPPIFLSEQEIIEFNSNQNVFVENNAIICKKNSLFTNTWLRNTHELLDRKFDELTKNPARVPRDEKGLRLPDGSVSSYPFRYPEVGPEQIGRAMWAHKDKILHYDILPIQIYHFPTNIPWILESKKQLVRDYLPHWPHKEE